MTTRLVRVPGGPKAAMEMPDGSAAIVRVDHVEARSAKQGQRRGVEAQIGRVSGRQWKKLRKAFHRQLRAAQRESFT